MGNIENAKFYVVRSPLYALGRFKSIPHDMEGLNYFIFTLWEDIIFKEALFVASNVLYEEWEKVIEGKSVSLKKRDRINISILKYFIRITTRSTPFGLFSTYSTVQINKLIPISSDTFSSSNIERFTSLSLFCVFSIVRYLNSNESVRNCLKYSLNTTLYKVGNSYRYIEMFIKNKERQYILVSLDSNEVLDFFFRNLNKAVTVEGLIQILRSIVDDIDDKDAILFINSLIETQIIVSDLDICINNGIDGLEQILVFFDKNREQFKDCENVKNMFFYLKKLQCKIDKLDSSFGNKIQDYYEIYKILDLVKIPYKMNRVLNIVVRNRSQKICLEDKDYKKIEKAVRILSCFSSDSINVNSSLELFKKAFYKRYEDKEMPLLVALDNELGVGYLQNLNNNTDYSELLDDIIWANQAEETEIVYFNKQIHLFWKRLFLEANMNHEIEIDLKNQNIPFLNNNLALLSNTFSVMINKTSKYLIIDNVGGVSSLNLIAKHSHHDNEMEERINKIVDIEGENDDIIRVELLHVPSEDSANIITRKINRSFELCLLTKGSNRSRKISLNDLYISIKRDKIVLRSKELNKEVKIFSTCSHNHYFNSLPIYHFLCDLQCQNILPNLSLNFGQSNLLTFDFRPRILWGEGIVLSPATWRFLKSDLYLEEGGNDLDIEWFKLFLKKKKVGRFFYLIDGDNKLLIDIDNVILLKLVMDTLKRNTIITLVECLYDLELDEFDNEMIIPYFNLKYRESVSHFERRVGEFKNERSFIPGIRWLYYKIYIGSKTADEFLIKYILPLVIDLRNKKIIKKWFFIRYMDPDFHIRIRFEINEKSKENVQKIIDLFNICLDDYVVSDRIWKVDLSTYERELERYNGESIDFAEVFFWNDSQLVLQLLSKTKYEYKNKLVWLLSLRVIDEYLNIFKITLDEKYSIMKYLYEEFQNEFKINREVRRQIEKKFRTYKDQIIDILENKSHLNEYHECNLLISKNVENFYSNNRKEIGFLSRNKRKDLVISFIHMHVNRFFRTNQRMHELVLYSLLSDFYKMKQMNLKYHK